MEEKFVRNMSLLVACLAILICSGLYYLPMLEVQAEEAAGTAWAWQG